MNLTQAHKLVVDFNQEDNQETHIEIKHPFDSEPLVAVIIDNQEVMTSVQHSEGVVIVEANGGYKGKVILIG